MSILRGKNCVKLRIVLIETVLTEESLYSQCKKQRQKSEIEKAKKFVRDHFSFLSNVKVIKVIEVNGETFNNKKQQQ